jgi:hypothetical protein
MYKNVGYAPEPALLELGVRFRRMALPDTERKYRAFHPTPTPTLAPRSAYCVASRDASDLAGNILLGLANIEIQAGREPTGAQLIVPNGDRKRICPMGRGILLWLLGVPIPVIIILLLIFHH